MKSNNANRLLILILAFYITSLEASHDDDVRILTVEIRGQSRFSAADLLSGRTDGGQEEKEIVKTPVITDEGRRMMLVTGPNLCEEDTARQIFTMLYLSFPGPHVVLMVLNLENQQSQQCDIVKRAQELLGEEVLQYCIVLLLQNHQEHLTGASREMINVCGGRFHIIRDSEPKHAQAAALVAEIKKLVWLNDHKFYSVLRQQLRSKRLEHLKRQSEIDDKLVENQVSSPRHAILVVIGWSLIILLITVLLIIMLTADLSFRHYIIVLKLLLLCFCVFIASVVLILVLLLLSLLKVYIEYFLSSFLFYPVLLLVSLMLIFSPQKRTNQNRT
ncbi:GTPase IMAP family member 2-like [Labeo rohita]|uniref:GTPase IMAP family member 2-like n=1 Tax=Labeo rohita TaxID=84645 RepID=UPI0021E2F508|nr:GTPase IMAP family member 2-like [Labeo rohita]